MDTSPRPCPERTSAFAHPLPHEWAVRRNTSGRTFVVWCPWCGDRRWDPWFEGLLDLLWAVAPEILWAPEVNQAVEDFVAGRPNALIDELRQSILDEEKTTHYPAADPTPPT